MSKEEAKRESVHHWWKMAEEALQSARMEYEADLLHGAINRAYYAVFYAAYDRLFEERQHGDYMVLTEFEPDDVKEKVESAAAFLKAVRELLSA